MSNLFYFPRQRSIPFAKLAFRISGTSTPQPVYTDKDLQVAHTDPVVADADGYFDVIYLDPSLPDYRVIHTDTNGVQLEPTLDDIPSSSNVSSTYRVKGTNPNIIFEETDATTNDKKWRIRPLAGVLKIEYGDDAESTWVEVASYSRNARTGTFTGTLTGVSGTVTGTVRYTFGNGFAALTLPITLQAAGSGATCSITGIPAFLRPTNVANLPIPTYAFLDDGVATAAFSCFSPNSSGVVFFDKSGNAAGFTGTGTRGVSKQFTIVYPLD